MSSCPRVVFLRFASADSPKLGPWKEHGRRVMGVAPAGTEPGSAVIWHLSSANNRMLGRSAAIYREVADAAESLRANVADFASWKIRLVGDEIRGNYGWYAAIDHEPVMICARWYTTERDRRHALDLALDSIVVADVSTGSRLVGG
ncbi:MAG: hypothetical protein JWN36_2847 [Microbacteriaceae bacterium]|nr:hypothetical protein [Microbacteriaceae bacterium]